MLNEHKDKITVLLMRQFDAEDQNITLRNGRIESICILNRENGEKELYQGDIFVDATYEGDLGAAAGKAKPNSENPEQEEPMNTGKVCQPMVAQESLIMQSRHITIAFA